MSDTETYLRDLRRALPIGCRRRFVAEVREHFASAADSGEPQHVTIERLGPADALAEQLLTDLRSGALGPAARLSAALTVTRMALAAVLVVAAVAGIAVVSLRSSSRTPPPNVQRPLSSGVVRNGVVVRRLIVRLATAQERNKRGVLPGGYVMVPRIYHLRTR